MSLSQIKAIPHPGGNRIDLTWTNLAPEQHPGVRVVRRVGTYPTLDIKGADPVIDRDGIVIAEGEGLTLATDEGLQSETVYYYTLYPYTGDPPVFQFDPNNRTAAMATGHYDLAGQMYALLPRIYHRYDTRLPSPSANVATADRQKGQLRRFLDLPGAQLDQFYSLARAVLDLHDIDKVDGRLLPLLAQWIAWQTNHRLEIGAQRTDIRNAPHVYKTIGIIPTVEATVKRLLGWESRTKEFVHNVFRTNTPERLNIWARQRNMEGEWSEPEKLFSMDDAFDGRIAAVRAPDNSTLLFYHTLRNGRWDVRYKTRPAAGDWSPSQPLTNRHDIDRHPTAAIQDDTTWVIWDVFDPNVRRWRIDFLTRTGDVWSAIAPFTLPIGELASSQPQRQRPWAVVDDADPAGLWLFWREETATGWQLRYNRHDGANWALDMPITFPLDVGDADPQVQDDLFVAFRAADQSLWVFWARQIPTGLPDQTRWQIAYRVKGNLTLDETGWSEVRTLPDAPLDSDEREPAVVVNEAGNLELFQSSNRGGSWSIWHGVLNPVTQTWITVPEVLPDAPYTQRHPSALALDGTLLLFYRSNASVVYTSSIYQATETLDARYAGSTTFDTRNVAKNALRGQYEDFQTYVYDAGPGGQRSEHNWYARDTAGMYLTPDTENPILIERNQSLIQSALRQFVSVGVRLVFIIEPSVHQEAVYTEGRRIVESYADQLSTVAGDVLADLNDASQDIAPGWVWLRSWTPGSPIQRTVDTSVTPPDLSERTVHTDVEEGG